MAAEALVASAVEGAMEHHHRRHHQVVEAAGVLEDPCLPAWSPPRP